MMAYKRLLCLLLALLMLPVGNIGAVTVEQLQQQIDTLEQEKEDLDARLQALEQQLDENMDQIEAMIAQKNLLDQQIFLLQESLANTQAQLTRQAELIAGQQELLDIAQANLEQLQNAHRLRIRAMEENGPVSYWAVLFEANSFSDLLDRIAMIEDINRADNRRLEEIRTAAQQVSLAQEALVQEKAQLETLRQEQQQALEAQAAKRAEADGLLQKLVASGQEYEQLLHEGELRQDQLMQELAQKKEEYNDATRPATPPPAPPASSAGWLTPVPYYTLSSPFGMRFHPILNIWRMHNGIDMACAEGTPIYASRSGVVTVAAYQADGAGNYVQLDHGDGFRSIYMHMTHYIVKPGQQVEAGQIIGYVGNTGLSKGNHLHFGISYNGTYVNPLEYIR